MKNYILKITFAFGFLLLGINMQAQKLIITDGVTNYDDQNRQCIIVQIEPNTKEVKGELKDWMDDEKDVDLKGFGFLRNKNVLKAREVSIAEISKNEMDFYAEIVENGEVTEMRIFGSFGYNIHISKDKFPKEFRAMKNMTINFLSDFLSEYYKDQIEDAQEMLSDLEKERKDLKKDIEDNVEEIADLKEENSELSKEIYDKNVKVKDASKKLKTEKEKLKTIKKKLKVEEEN